MDKKTLTDRILEGADIKTTLTEETAYDEAWEKKVWDASKDIFSADKKLWDLMAFAPDKYYTDELQDALNAFNSWYQKFLKVKGEN